MTDNTTGSGSGHSLPPGAIASRPTNRFTPTENNIYTNAVSMAITPFDLTMTLGRNAVETLSDGTQEGYAVSLVAVTMSLSFAKVLIQNLQQAVTIAENVPAAAQQLASAPAPVPKKS